MKKLFGQITIIFFGIFLLAVNFAKADLATCGTATDTGNVTVYCQLPDKTCKPSPLPASKKDDPLAQCITFGATFVDCVTTGSPAPAACPAAPAASSGTPASGSGTTQSNFDPNWTKDECAKAGGDWIPDTGKTSGQYCYARQDINYAPQISIGGTTIKNLGDYVAQAYNYAIGFVMMIAIIMVMIGGVQWIMARGGGGVEAAKKRISNAVLGVVLLLAAYLILNTISPAIVKLSLPRVPLLKQNKFAFSDVANCGGYKDAASCNANAVGMNKGWSCYAPQGTTSAGCKWDAASKSCVMAPAALAGALYSQCPDGKCNEGLFCATVLSTGNCKICSDGKRGSPCNEDSNCTDADSATCDKNIKQCRGDKMRPIGSECSDDNQCVGGPCDKGICKSGAILNKEGLSECTANQYRPADVYSITLKQYMQYRYPTADMTVAIEKRTCESLGDAGEGCFLSAECKSGSCDKDNINRNANDIKQIVEGDCQ